jgi:hypothetical protein
VLELMAAITGEGEAKPWEYSREYWYCRDLAGRLIEIMAQCEGEVYRELEKLIDILAEGNRDALETGISGYVALFEDYELPEPKLVMATGYPLPQGYGRASEHILEGARSACPLTFEQLDERQDGEVLGQKFAATDPFQRQPMGHRFAEWLTHQPGLEDLANLAHVEASIAHVPQRSAAVLSLSSARHLGKRFHLAEDVLLVYPNTFASNVLGIPIADEDIQLLIRRNPQTQAEVVAVEPRLRSFFNAIHNEGFAEADHIEPDDLKFLVAQGFIVPERYAL